MFIQKYTRALSVIAKKPIMLWGLSLLSILLNAIASIVTAPILVLSLAASYLFGCGMCKVYLDGLNGKEVDSSQLFSAFSGNVVRTAGGMAWRDLWVVIWSLFPFGGFLLCFLLGSVIHYILGIVLGVIVLIAGAIYVCAKKYSYNFVPYILMTKPDVTATDALKLSMKLTKGRKLQMFLADFCIGLILGFIGLILGLLSMIPYIGVVFRIILIAFAVLVALFLPIFTGLYQAAFYDDKPVAPAQPRYQQPQYQQPQYQAPAQPQYRQPQQAPAQPQYRQPQQAPTQQPQYGQPQQAPTQQPQYGQPQQAPTQQPQYGQPQQPPFNPYSNQ